MAKHMFYVRAVSASAALQDLVSDPTVVNTTHLAEREKLYAALDVLKELEVRVEPEN